uniref:Uncharacterized protein n=1 Tax=Desulfobacca acetoxidans TaxID=60893 RepID=A0A7C3UYV7_9BACT
MASEPAKQPGRRLAAIGRCLKIFLLNLWRRLLILGRYLVICFHQQRLCRAWRLLGRQIHQAVEGGEVNPMAVEEVQDRLAKAQMIQETKQRHYQAIAALREKIQASRAGEPPPPAESQASEAS